MSPIYVPGKVVLDSGNRPTAIAGVAPTLDYRFARERREVEAVSLTDKLTYTGGNGTFVGSDGFIQQATTNVPRFDHDPVSQISKGLLVENARTNLSVPSDTSSRWQFTSTGDGVITPKYGIAPDGTRTTTRVQPNSSTRVFRNFISSGISTTGNYVISFFVKGSVPVAVSGPGFNVSPSNWTLLGQYGTFSRYARSVTATGTGYLDFTYNSGSDGEIWGVQVEKDVIAASSYISTTTVTSTVTRTADSAIIDGTGVLTGTYTMVEKPAGCAVESGGNIELQAGYTAERVMVFPAALSAQQITDIRSAM